MTEDSMKLNSRSRLKVSNFYQTGTKSIIQVSSVSYFSILISWQQFFNPKYRHSHSVITKLNHYVFFINNWSIKFYLILKGTFELQYFGWATSNTIKPPLLYSSNSDSFPFVSFLPILFSLSLMNSWLFLCQAIFTYLQMRYCLAVYVNITASNRSEHHPPISIRFSQHQRYLPNKGNEQVSSLPHAPLVTIC